MNVAEDFWSWKMSKGRIPSILLVAVAAIVLGGFSPGGAAQSTPSAAGQAQPSISRELNDQELRGEGLFLQRCALCHLPKRNKSCCQNPLGPILSGRFKGASPDVERAVREQILKGSANMPGFQYGLSAVEIDAVIAYLKTF